MQDVPRWLMLKAEIDFCMFMLNEISGSAPKTSITAMIDKATGYDMHRMKQAAQVMRDLVPLWREWQELTGEDSSSRIQGCEAFIAEYEKQEQGNV